MTENESDLLDLLCSRSVSDTSCVGIMLTLGNEKKYIKMLRWVKKNPRAGQYEIIEYLDKICPPEVDSAPQDFAQQNPAQRKTRKIAVV